MVGPSVGEHEPSGETRVAQGLARRARLAPDFGKRGRGGARAGRMTDRIMAEVDVEGGCGQAAFSRERGEEMRNLQGAPARVETQRNEVELLTRERGVEIGFAFNRNAEAPRGRGLRNGEDERVRAIFQVLARQRIGGGRVGMIHSLGNAPGARLLPQGARRIADRARIERLDPQAFGRGRDESFEGAPAKRARYDLAPAREVRRRKQVRDIGG